MTTAKEKAIDKVRSNMRKIEPGVFLSVIIYGPTPPYKPPLRLSQRQIHSKGFKNVR